MKYQDPLQADTLMRTQRELDDVRDTMMKNIDQLLARGEQLQSLMDRSEDLSFQSKVFLRETDQGCCVIL